MMDEFLVQIVLLDELALLGIGILLTFVGAVLANIFVTVRFSLRRVAYLWFLAATTLAIMLSQYLWLGMGMATEMGLFSPFVIALLSITVLYGAVIFIGSAARSNHICGKTKFAWLGFVPFANLWLLMKGGEEKPGTVIGGPKLSMFADTVLVIAALFVFALSRAATAHYETIEPDPDSYVAFNGLRSSVQTVEESFAFEVNATAPTLPMRIDETTVFTSITAYERKMRMAFTIDDPELDYIDPTFKNLIATEQCAPEMFGRELANGGTIVFAYLRPDGSMIREFTIEGVDCTV